MVVESSPSFFAFVATKKVMVALLSSPSVFVLLQRRRQRQLLFWFCYSEEGDGSKAVVAFFCFGFVVTKERDDTKVIVTFLFCFCCSEEGDDNFVAITFLCFDFVAAKKVMIALLQLLSSVLILL